MLTVYGDQPAKLVLPQDESLAKPRTLLLKLLSKKDVRAWQRRKSEAMEIASMDARDAAYDALLGEVVTGWENIPGEFSVAAISEQYTLPEFMVILEIVPMAMSLRAEDLKK